MTTEGQGKRPRPQARLLMKRPLQFGQVRPPLSRHESNGKRCWFGLWSFWRRLLLLQCGRYPFYRNSKIQVLTFGILDRRDPDHLVPESADVIGQNRLCSQLATPN